MLSINFLPKREEDFCIFNPMDATVSFFNKYGFQLIEAIEEVGDIDENQLYDLCPEEMRFDFKKFIEDCIEQKILLRT